MSDGAALLLVAAVLLHAACTAGPRITDTLVTALLLAGLAVAVVGATLLANA